MTNHIVYRRHVTLTIACWVNVDAVRENSNDDVGTRTRTRQKFQPGNLKYNTRMYRNEKNTLEVIKQGFFKFHIEIDPNKLQIKLILILAVLMYQRS